MSTATKSAQTGKGAGKTVTLSDIAKSMKMDPKTARRRLRNSQMKKPKSGWIFAIKQRPAIVKLLKGGD